jgi:hypothetical protein
MPNMLVCIDELLDIVSSSQNREERLYSSALRTQLDSALGYLCTDDGVKAASELRLSTLY